MRELAREVLYAVEAERCGWQMTDRLWGGPCGVWGRWVGSGRHCGKSRSEQDDFQATRTTYTLWCTDSGWDHNYTPQYSAIREDETGCGALRLCTEKQEFKWNSLSCLTHRLTGETAIYTSVHF